MIIFNAITAPQKSNPFRLFPGDTLSIRTTVSSTVSIYSNPILPYVTSNDNLVQTETDSVDLVAPSECILVLDVSALSGSLKAEIIRSKYSNE